MEWYCKRYDELTLDELYRILQLRSAVFVVEQNCPYQDIDGIDPECLHLFAVRDGSVRACLRLYWKSDEENVVKLGRVVTADRGVGLGGELLRRGVEIAFSRMKPREIYIEAQQYAEGFYAREGFVTCSEPFLEDGIPHVQMRLRAANRPKM
ncbi:MAG: GNAT family N-acetyltransferase [Oscillospiraceae bacterium]|nr:GNAT family N-acetyltransferase [Oscillospiraceae bacterium]